MRWVCLLVILSGCPRSILEEDAGVSDAGDGGCTPRTFSGACAAVAGAVFASVTKGECGRCPTGQDCSCTWHLTFSGTDSWSWQHSDYGESGTYACTGLDLTGTSGLSTYAASYAPRCDELTWAGVVYRREK